MASVVGGPCYRANSTGTDNQARGRRLETGDWFVSPLHPLHDNREQFGYRQGTCPVAEALCERVVNLPTLPGIATGRP